MSKLTANDIVILGEGPQIRKHIEARYRNVKDFHVKTEFPLSLKTLRTYLSYDEIKSDTFKGAVVKIFNEDFHKLAKSKPTQVKDYVWNIFNKIKLYNSKEAFKTLVNVYELCRQYELNIEASMMCRAKAMNCFYRNYTDWAIELYVKAIKLMENLNKDLYVLFIIELADLYYREDILIKSETEYKKVEEHLAKHKVSDSTLFKYYYRRGIMLNRIGEHSKAREFFDDACKHTNDIEEKAGVMTNIGVTYKKELNYEKALEYYFKSLDYFDEKVLVGRGVIYNNIAGIYLEKGNLREALLNSIKAIALISLADDATNTFIFSQTYIHIKLLMGDVSACEEFLNILKRTANKQINRKFIIEGICSIVELLDDVEIINKFIITILELINHTTNKEFGIELYMCIGKLQERAIKLSEVEVFE